MGGGWLLRRGCALRMHRTGCRRRNLDRAGRGARRESSQQRSYRAAAISGEPGRRAASRPHSRRRDLGRRRRYRIVPKRALHGAISRAAVVTFGCSLSKSSNANGRSASSAFVVAAVAPPEQASRGGHRVPTVAYPAGGAARVPRGPELRAEAAGPVSVQRQGCVPGAGKLFDTERGVNIDVLSTRRFPGDDKPKPMAFPDPETAALRGERPGAVLSERHAPACSRRRASQKPRRRSYAGSIRRTMRRP